MTRVTARKYQGDDAYSWAVFLDGRPIVTGLSKGEVAYWKRRITEEAVVAQPATAGYTERSAQAQQKENNR